MMYTHIHTYTHTYVREKEDNMDICDWLREFLRDGPKEVGEIRRAARAAGYTRGDLREAKRICFIRVTNNYDRYEHPFVDRWFWYLPEDEQA